MTSAAEAYRLLAPEYDTQPNPVLSLVRRTLPELFPPLEGTRVVDVAAGTGYWSRWCAARGASTIGVDLSDAMLAHAPRPAVIADAANLPFPDARADIVVCSLGLSYAPGSFAELARIIRSGGFVIAVDVHPAALDRGWKRIVKIEMPRYRIEDLRAPGLVLEILREPCFGEPERHIYEAAGKADQLQSATDGPAIFAARWRRE